MCITLEKDGKEALTQYKVLKTFKVNNLNDVVSLLDVKIHTGRTHQIRVHMAAIGYPVVGDKTYGNRKVNILFDKKFALKRQFLHAYRVFFELENGKKLEVSSKLPPDLDFVIKSISQV
jgi:23S rRNA-/tRNA-specific pseudouridylate synthase